MKRAAKSVALRKGGRRILLAEMLEARWLLSAYVVNTLSDSANPGTGLLTLRQAIADADADSTADAITFDASLFPDSSQQSIALTQGALTVSKISGALSITGPGAGLLAVDGGATSQVFYIGSGTNLSLASLTVTDGLASPTTAGADAMGGGIENAGTLTLTSVTVSNNVAQGGAPATEAGSQAGSALGGGIYSTGTLTLQSSTVTGNTAAGGSLLASQTLTHDIGGSANGGGIYATGPVTVNNSTIGQNAANGTDGARLSTNGYYYGFAGDAEGGGIATTVNLTITGSVVAGNRAQGGTESSDTGDGNATGGGVYAGQSLTVSNTTFSGNSATGGSGLSPGTANTNGGNAQGGAIYVGGRLMLSGSTLTGNDASGGFCGLFGNDPGSGSGGAIFAIGNQQISSSSFTSNSAGGNDAGGVDSGNTPGGSGFGGAIFGQASLTISSSTISNNKATAGTGGNDFPGVQEGSGSGGGISVESLTMTQCTVSGNSAVGGEAGYSGATGGTGSGGGITTGNATITASTISGNSATGGAGVTNYANIGPGGAAYGGGLVASGGTLTNDTIVNNTATGGAGGPASTDGQGSGTGAGGAGGNASGGGIEAGSLTIADCTITGNSAVGGAGGAGNSDYPAGANGVGSGGGLESSSNPILDNTIVSTNSANSAPNDIGGTASSSSGGNLIGVGGGLSNGVNGNHVGVTNPQLSALRNNGGPTLTIQPLSGSPAIDAGQNSLIPAGVTTDQRGVPRIANGTVDIGAVEVQFGVVSGTVFNDLNGDGVQQSGEAGLAGRTVYIDLNNNGVLDPGEPFTTTNSSGNYALSGLPAGADIIRQVLPAGWRESYPALGGGDHVTVSSTPVTGANFGATNGIFISGAVFNDVNRNGKQDSGESGIAGWTVYIDLNNSGKLTTADPTTTTGSTGGYSFAGLAAGTYIVRVIPAAGWSQTYPTNNYGQHVTLGSGQVNTNVPFGFFLSGGAISGTAAAGSTGVAGVTIYLDSNNDDKLDNGELSTVTNSSGGYSFAGLAPGAYIVRQILPSGYQQITPVDNYGNHITVSAGTTTSGVNFSDKSIATASISGEVFNDANGDGKLGNGETGLSGWSVYIDLNNSGAFISGDPTTTTNSLGDFTFSGLAAGTYIVRVIRPSGWSQTYPTNNYGQHITVATGQTVANVLFGEKISA